MVKLSQQLQSSRLTRTQRVIGKRTAQLENIKRRKDYQALKEKAEQIQQEKFSNITNLNDYEKQYNSLSPDIKQFFSTPQQLRTEQTQRIKSNIPKVEEKIFYAREQNNKNETDFRKDWNQVTKISDTKQRQDEKRKLKNEYDEEKKYWKGYLKGLGEGLNKLKTGQDISYNDVENYADDLGDYEENQERAENKQKDSSKKAYKKLLTTSPYRIVIQEHETKYKGKVDWSRQQNVSAIAKQSYVKQYGGIIAENIALGKGGRIVEVYKGIVGNKEFTKQSSKLTSDYNAFLKEQGIGEAVTIKPGMTKGNEGKGQFFLTPQEKASMNYEKELSRVGTTSWSRANTFLQKKVTQPTSKFIYEKTGVTKESFGTLAFMNLGIEGEDAIKNLSPKFKSWIEPKETYAKEFGASSVAGYLGGLKDKPLKTAVTTGVFFALPKVLGTIGKLGITKLATKLPKTSKVLGTGLKYGLPAVYTTSIITRVGLTPGDAKAKGYIFGEIASTELTPMAVGGYAGAKFWKNWDGFLSTLKRKEIKAEDIIIKDVRTGKKTFVESGSYGYKGKLGEQKQKFDVQLFTKEGKAYHVTQKKFWKDYLEIIPGKKEFKGLYVAPSPSTYFIKGGLKGYGGSLFTPYTSPGIAEIYPKGFKISKVTRVPGVKKMPGTHAFIDDIEGGVVYVTGVKAEAEGVFPFGADTKIGKIGTNAFLKWKGQRIPIDTFVASSSDDIVKAIATKIKNFEQVNVKDLISSSSYGGKGSYPITTPGSYLFGSLLASSKISKGSNKYSSDVSKIVSKIESNIMKSGKSSVGSSFEPYASKGSSVGIDSSLKSIMSKISKIESSYGGSSYGYTPTKTTTPKALLPYLNWGGKPKKRKKKLKKAIYDLLYVPDFTSRALGLEPTEISEAQAKKQLKKILSGLEIRQPVLVRKKRKRRKKK